MNLSDIINVIDKLENYIISEDYKGYDPYDVLNSPLFKLPVLRSNKLIRFGAQQVFRRIPINLRSVLGIKKEVNPVTLGLCIQAFTYLSEVFKEKKDFYKNQIEYCLERLIELSSKGYSGYCWGYNFDWEARYARIPKFTPTVVATGIIINGLYEYYKLSKDNRVKDIILSSANFVLKDLNRSFEGDTFCFSYSPNDNQKVFNATMKAARLLAQAYYLNKNEEFKIEAQKTLEYVLKYQRLDGSWFYSNGDGRKWIDNFHTAYVLDSLIFCNEAFDNIYIKQYKLGFNYYLKTFFNDGELKYYAHNKYPIDSTEIAQSIITLVNNGYLDLAFNVINFGLKNLWTKMNYFYYRRYKFFANKISYIRWSNAWMLVSLSYYCKRILIK